VPKAPSSAARCQFGCPNFSAIGPDEKGNLQACYCLPGYSLTGDKTSCSFGSGHQCSIFNYGSDAQRQALLSNYGIQTPSLHCGACNSNTRYADTVGCHSGVFLCDLTTTTLDGDCAERLTVSQANQCIANKTNFSCNCDGSCSASCADPDACMACCTC